MVCSAHIGKHDLLGRDYEDAFAEGRITAGEMALS